MLKRESLPKPPFHVRQCKELLHLKDDQYITVPHDFASPIYRYRAVTQTWTDMFKLQDPVQHHGLHLLEKEDTVISVKIMKAALSGNTLFTVFSVVRLQISPYPELYNM